jgi:hypothetical protein
MVVFSLLRTCPRRVGFSFKKRRSSLEKGLKLKSIWFNVNSKSICFGYLYFFFIIIHLKTQNTCHSSPF